MLDVFDMRLGVHSPYKPEPNLHVCIYILSKKRKERQDHDKQQQQQEQHHQRSTVHAPHIL